MVRKRCAFAPPLGNRALCKRSVCSMHHAHLFLWLLTWLLLHNQAPPRLWTSPLAFSTGLLVSSSSPVDTIPATRMQTTTHTRQDTNSVRQLVTVRALLLMQSHLVLYAPQREKELKRSHLSVCNSYARGPSSGETAKRSCVTSFRDAFTLQAPCLALWRMFNTVTARPKVETKRFEIRI